MNRRTAFKNLAFATGSLITLPSWMVSIGLSDTTSYYSHFSPIEQTVLAAVADTIIPPGNAVGAIAVGVDKYLQKLIEDCYEPSAQDNVKKQLLLLDQSAKTLNGQTFAACSHEQRKQLLLKLDSPHDKDGQEFFRLLKSETIRGFTTSQKVMVDYLGYKTAPGHYYGSVNLKAEVK